METQLLKDQKEFPDNKALVKALGGSYPAFEELMMIITGPEFNMEAAWNYYRDGKAWLCKASYKKNLK